VSKNDVLAGAVAIRSVKGEYDFSLSLSHAKAWII
jgi:hypothetical protein